MTIGGGSNALGDFDVIYASPVAHAVVVAAAETFTVFIAPPQQPDYWPTIKRSLAH